MTSTNKETIILPIVGMSCFSCVQKIEAGLKIKKGVLKAQVDLGDAEAMVSYIPSHINPHQLAQVVEKEGYQVGEIRHAGKHFEAVQKKTQSIFNSPGPYIKGVLAAFGIVGFYLGLLTLTSDWYFATVQFEEFGVWILLLAVGLGIQVFLYSNLRQHIKNLKGAGKTVAVSGGLSTAGMAACCAHYLVTVLPVLGVPFVTTAIASLAKYQTVFFLIGVLSNIGGILFMLNLMRKNRMIEVPRVFTRLFGNTNSATHEI